MRGNILLLKDVWPIDKPDDYKIHFATHNGDHHPLDLWLEDRDEWESWQRYHPQKNEFNRKYIFSAMQFHHEGKNVWLFGGIFRVLARREDSREDHGYRYEVALMKHGESFIGRLKFAAPSRTSRTTRAKFERHYHSLEVLEILREPFSGRPFPGFENINVSFTELQTLIRNRRPDWRSSLENVHGIYMITDTSTGRRYVGSAYGDTGIWSRWETYVDSGHGGNNKLKELLGDGNWEDYARHNFRYSLIEYHPKRTSKDIVIRREEFWKETLLTKGEYGLNE